MLHIAAAASILAAAAAGEPPAPAPAPAAGAPPAGPAPANGVIAYDQAFFASANPANAFEMIQRLPGFAFDEGDSVRGFEGAAGNVLIDGKRPITKTDDLEEILRRVPASAVARIELIRGGAPGVDMQGKAVLANVVRKDGGGFRGLAAVANNHVYDGRNAVGVRLEASGGTGQRNWEASARWGEGIDDGAGEGPRTRVDRNGAPLRLAAMDANGNGETTTLTGAYEMPALGGTLRVNGRLFQDFFDYDEVQFVTFPGPDVERSHDGDDTREAELGLRYSRPLNARSNLELIGLFQRGEELFGASFAQTGYTEAFNLDRETGESIVRGVLSYRHSPSLSFEAGAEGAFNQLESQTRYVKQGAPVDLPAANVKVEEKRGEVFAKAVWKPRPAWTVEAGLRGEGSAVSSEGDVGLEKTLYFPKPRLALTWAPNERTQFRARLERTVGQLDFDDFVADSSLSSGDVTAGNPDLEPESAWVAEAAFERRFWTKGALVVAVRHSELSDVVDRAPVFGATETFDAPANIGEGTKDELIVNLTLPFDPIGLKGAQLQAESTWRRSEVTDPTTGESREISDLRPVEWEAHFTHDLPKWRVNWGVDVFGGWRETSYRFDQVYDVKLKTYVRPFVEWKPQPDLAVRLELPNVTERGLRYTRTVYEGPRGANPVAYVDDRDYQFGRMYYLRVRKSFGG